MPLHYSAAGKAILSMYSSEFQHRYIKKEEKTNPTIRDKLAQVDDDLERVKRLGYTVTPEEIDSYTSCIAAPILNLRNEPVAALSAAISGEPFNPQGARHYSKNLVQAARQLSSRMV